MVVKTCETCGKVFFCKSTSRIYCSKECKTMAVNQKKDEMDQLCWRCKKACAGCSWTKFYEPVNGWNAESTIVKDSCGDFTSYRIKGCPEFVVG